MSQNPIPRDPHADNDLIDAMEVEPGAQSGQRGGRVAEEIATRDEAKSALGSDPEATRDHKGDKVQPNVPTRADHEGAQSL